MITLVIIATTESYRPSFESSLFKEQQNSEWLSGEIDCHFLKVTDYIDCFSIKDEGPLGYSKFKHAPMFIDLVTFSGKKFVTPVTYKYTLEDGILTLSLEQKQDLDNGQSVTLYYTMRFKKVAE